MVNNSPKFLIIRSGKMSDVLNCFSVFSSIKKKYPNSSIHLYTSRNAENLLSYEPSINKFFSVEKMSFSAFRKLIYDLKNEHYDYVINLENSLIALFITVFIGAKKVVSYQEDLSMNIAENYFESVNSIFKNLQYSENFKLCIPEHILKSAKVANPLDRPFVVISSQISTLCDGRKWKMEKFKALAESLVEKYNVSVFFIGTAFERDLLSKVENVDKNIFNFAGRFNPLELAAFLSLSSCVIGIDSSPVYIASSTRTTSCIALYGAGSPFRKIAFPEKFYPISAKNPPCSPCSKRFCKLRNDEYAPCMDNISVDDVMSVIDKEKLLQLNENLI